MGFVMITTAQRLWKMLPTNAQGNSVYHKTAPQSSTLLTGLPTLFYKAAKPQDLSNFQSLLETCTA
jgi:acyl-CoA reductase-like NAD-dependent aldehyde dehydrogenase